MPFLLRSPVRFRRFCRVSKQAVYFAPRDAIMAAWKLNQAYFSLLPPSLDRALVHGEHGGGSVQIQQGIFLHTVNYTRLLPFVKCRMACATADRL